MSTRAWLAASVCTQCGKGHVDRTRRLVRTRDDARRQSAPPAQLLTAMALLLTGFGMASTLREVNGKAITPWLDGQITQVEMMKTGVVPMREIMLKQTRESDSRRLLT